MGGSDERLSRICPAEVNGMLLNGVGCNQIRALHRDSSAMGENRELMAIVI